MRWLVPIAIILILAACVEQPAEKPTPTGELGVPEETETGLETMPEFEETGEDTSLTGQPMDLGSLI